MSRRYGEVITEIGQLNAEVKGIFDTAGDEALDKETYQKVITNNKKIEELEHEAKELLEQIEAKNEANRRQQEHRTPAPGSRLSTPTTDTQPDAGKDARSAHSLGDHVLEDPEFKTWRERKMIGANGSAVSKAQFGNSPAYQAKALITSGVTSAGPLVVNDYTRIIDAGVSRRPLMIRSLVTNGRTGSDLVEYVREGTHTNAAATVAEASATSGASGSKPESTMALALVQEAVKTIAHYIPATRRSLSDAGQMRTLIDNFLIYGLEEELEEQMMTGDGTGENFTGLLNVSGTTAQAWDTNILTTTRKARTKVRTVGRAQATAYVLHPNDWQTIDLLQDNEARYYFGGPSVIGTPRLWGLPVVESEAITEGVGMVADWALAVLWDREESQIMVSDSHSDFFIRNLIAILAEMRAAFGCLRPAAFVEIDLTA